VTQGLPGRCQVLGVKKKNAGVKKEKAVCFQIKCFSYIQLPLEKPKSICMHIYMNHINYQHLIIWGLGRANSIKRKY
jgi:hypothetical protein